MRAKFNVKEGAWKCRYWTPSGYKSPSALANGDDVCAFDMVSGAPIINQVENIDFVVNPMVVTGTASLPIMFLCNTATGNANMALAASSTFEWCLFRDLTFTGSPVANNSFDLGITITAPSSGGGVIGC